MSTRRKLRTKRYKAEYWNRYGNIRALRDKKGRFVHWHTAPKRRPSQRRPRIVRAEARRHVSERTYGRAQRPTARPEAPVTRYARRYFKEERGQHVDMYGGAVSFKHPRPRHYRWQFRGSGKQLQKAVKKGLQHPPKRQFETVSAEKFIENPNRYWDEDGDWIERPDITS